MLVHIILSYRVYLSTYKEFLVEFSSFSCRLVSEFVSGCVGDRFSASVMIENELEKMDKERVRKRPRMTWDEAPTEPEVCPMFFLIFDV